MLLTEVQTGLADTEDVIHIIDRALLIKILEIAVLAFTTLVLSLSEMKWYLYLTCGLQISHPYDAKKKKRKAQIWDIMAQIYFDQ